MSYEIRVEFEVDYYEHLSYTYRLIPLGSELNPVSKFKYLKELLDPKLRLLIDTLPSTSEGYSRAIAELKAKFRKSSEVSAAHIQCITSLPVISNSNLN